MQKDSLPPVWQCLTDDYIIHKVQGQGKRAQVVKATVRKTGNIVAIKYIKNAFEDIKETKQVFREVAILRRLSSMDNNIFTIKLLDVVLPRLKNKKMP